METKMIAEGSMKLKPEQLNKKYSTIGGNKNS
jgi:hypothetical protein